METLNLFQSKILILNFHVRFEKQKTEIKVHLEIRFNFRNVLLDFQSFTEKPVLEYPFVYIIFLSYLVKNNMNRASVVCELAMKWYLMSLVYRQDHNDKTNAKGCRIFGGLDQIKSKYTMQ